MAKKQKDLAQEELLEALKLQGRKLGFLIWVSGLPKEVRLELVVLISEMDLAQIQELIVVFEVKYTDSQTKDIDEKFKQDIKEILKKYQKSKEELELDFRNKLLEFQKNYNL